MANPANVTNLVEGKNMSNIAEQSQHMTPVLETQVVENVLLSGDLAKLQPAQRVAYYRRVCDSLGLNFLTQPFAYLHLNGKLVLYARRECAEQLRKLHRISLTIVSTTAADGVYEVRVHATMPDGRADEDMGATSILNLRGDALVNARLKALTKAKRRVTLSICGLGWLDESEIDTIPDAHTISVNPQTGEIDHDITPPSNGKPQSHLAGSNPAQPVMDMKDSNEPGINGVATPAPKGNGKLSDSERADILVAFDGATTLEEARAIRRAALRRASEVRDRSAYDQFERVFQDIKEKWLGSDRPDDPVGQS